MNLRVYEEKIVKLQRKLEDLLGEDEELRMKASRGEMKIIFAFHSAQKSVKDLILYHPRANYREAFNTIFMNPAPFLLEEKDFCA